MFSFDEYLRRYRDMPFAPWTGEVAERRAIADALAVLEQALCRCQDEDMRVEAVMAALDFLEPRCARAWPVRNFRKSFEICDPVSRWQNVNAALNGIRRQFSL